MAEAIRFLLGEELREVAIDDPTVTVLNYLRGRERRTGSKEGCAEGDCGACTVALGEVENGRLVYRAVNSCIQFLPTLHGKQLLTVEDLAGPEGKLHPVQRAMVDCHGSQCGFCTPGFVMSLFVMFHDGAPIDRARIDDALAGNLCRCTGYGPIIAAAERMRSAGTADRFSRNEKRIVDALEAMRSPAPTHAGERGYYAPRHVDELAELLLCHPDACILAGGTDVGLWVTKQHRRLDPVVYIGAVEELQRFDIREREIEIGAGVTYSRLFPIIAAEYPNFGEVLRRLGSAQIRNCGTMVGNIANGSPIGDSPPPLIALGARLVLRRGKDRREIPLEAFFIAYGKQDRRPGEFVESLLLPRRDPAWNLHCYKISKRFDQDITACLGAFNLKLAKGKVADIRICFGGMAATPKRALACEAALRGRPWIRETIIAGQAALARDYEPISDMRASRSYRARVAGNLLLKFWHETTEPHLETRVVGPRRAHG
ncbi:MAG TPA: xanthine dehydrogenase small subunit [Candidatus Udaeobacter sp.]|nr:xanthine dehydrogenase small subunit [Candidatus Udaeobacter sp.]